MKKLPAQFELPLFALLLSGLMSFMDTLIYSPPSVTKVIPYLGQSTR